MAGNKFGNIFTLTTFGESHGEAIGGIIDGCPAGLNFNIDLIQRELDRRRPGQSNITTQRKESDEVQILSGVFEGKTIGTPIGFIIKNEDQKSKDYSHIKDAYRPSHADFTFDKKYGIRDYRGGGRASARETASRIVGGGVAKMINSLSNINIHSYVSQVGNIKMDKSYSEIDFTLIDSNKVRCPDEASANKMISLIEQIKKEGDTVGGIITCVIQNVPIGLGEPVFDKLHAELGKAMFSINAVKGVEFGSGFDCVKMKGSEHNDVFESISNNEVKTKTNYSGGIQGGISNGEDIYFNVAFKPVATIIQKQTSINNKGEKIEIQGRGRHDPCVLPRAVPIVDSMVNMVIADYLLMNRNSKI